MKAHMTSSTPEQNKALVLEAFNTLFNKRDYDAASRFWSDKYIQHSAHISPGREGLLNLISSSPQTLKYEPGLILAEGKFVIAHGRFSGNGRPRNWIAADSPAGRSDRSRVAKRSTDVRDQVSRLSARSA